MNAVSCVNKLCKLSHLILGLIVSGDIIAKIRPLNKSQSVRAIPSQGCRQDI